MTKGTFPNIIQISSSLDRRLGGPATVVSDTFTFINKEYGSELIVFGSNNLVKNAFQVSTLFNNRYGFPKSTLKKRISEKLKNADLVLIHGFYLFSTLLAVSIAKKSRIMILPHGSLEEYQQNTGRFRKKVFDWLIIKKLGKRNLIFMVTSNSEALSVNRRFPKSKILNVGLGITLFQREFVESNNLDSQISLLSFSRIATKKRIDLSIRAVKSLREKGLNYRLEIYGDGEAVLVSKLKALASDLDISEFVKFHGYVQASNFGEVFKNIDIFLLPSENENFAVAVAESIAFGKPVVVSKFVAMHEFVDQHNAGLTINSLEVDELVTAIEIISKNFSSYQKNCISSAPLLAWDLVIKRWFEAIESNLVENE
jgi:glycosyltransferase involved in cell wall biosynthesis